MLIQPKLIIKYSVHFCYRGKKGESRSEAEKLEEKKISFSYFQYNRTSAEKLAKFYSVSNFSPLLLNNRNSLRKLAIEDLLFSGFPLSQKITTSSRFTSFVVEELSNFFFLFCIYFSALFSWLYFSSSSWKNNSCFSSTINLQRWICKILQPQSFNSDSKIARVTLRLRNQNEKELNSTVKTMKIV